MLLQLRSGKEIVMFRRFLKSFRAGALIALLIWFVVSFAEVNHQNIQKSPEYGKYNIFRIISGYGEE